jgi:hypothetical protein
MASFAKLNSENIVEQVISIHNNELLDNGVESEAKGIAFCKSLYGQDTNWKQTSYNTIAGIHNNGGTPFRKNHASIGYTYDQTKDAFIPRKPYESWVLNEFTCQWEAPIPMPNDVSFEKMYYWNEQTLSWDLPTT